MNDEPESADGLGPQDRELAERLSAGRPVPAAGFRGALGRHLSTRDPGYGPRPEHLRLMIAAYLALGLVLIALGALAAGAL